VFGVLLLAENLLASGFVLASLRRNSDAYLLEQARDLAQTYLVTAAQEQEKLAGCAFVNRVVGGSGADVRHRPRHVMLYVPSDPIRVVCSDHEERPLAWRAGPAFARARRGTPTYVSVDWPTESMRILSYPFRSPRGEDLVLEIGASLVAVDRTVAGGILILVALNAMAMAAIAGSSWFLSLRILGPVEALVTKVDQVARECGLTPEVTGTQRTTIGLGTVLGVLERALDRLQRSFEAQRRLAGDVAHEVRSPLTVLRGQLEVALRKDRTVEDYKTVLKESLEEVVKLARLSEDLLSVAQIDAGALSLGARDVELREVIGSVVQRLRPQAERQGLELRVEIEHDATVQGDPDCLGRIVENLLDNALAYSSPSGQVVVVRLARSGNLAELSVQDFGCGIAAADVPRIFERFYRAPSAPRRREGGAGLGLTIALGLAELHRGRIRVESRPGAGSIVTLVLPATPSSPVDGAVSPDS
jgi:two-component system OmpR family sensor kinase